ncbi:hypothetical protein [Streptomyces fuscichromogenes]|uniref:Uncharacterized protein n=1 Tax=Streptomyces fuscichromogenes TaxID=1324013 RepID=A0A918CWX3_9ACTN|nr:hypothetical protein [Streptomyces fuscichromogenes]GGN41275.1 hypothetical protein GCM10011578_089400 [Streptomyces fuscichromogenes]
MTTTGTAADTWYRHLKVNGVPYPVRTNADVNGSPYDVLGFTTEQWRRQTSAHELGHMLTARHYGMRMDYLTLGRTLNGSEAPGSGCFGATHGPGQSNYSLAVMSAAGERASDRWMREAGLWTPERAVVVECMADNDRAATLRYVPRTSFDDGPFSYSRLHDDADHVLGLYWDNITGALDQVITRDHWTGDEIAGLTGLTNPTL